MTIGGSIKALATIFNTAINVNLPAVGPILASNFRVKENQA
jgi:hypothetical protein